LLVRRGSVCLRVLAAIGLVPVRPGGSFARRPQEEGNVGIPKYQAGRIDRSGERRIFEPPPKPSSQSKRVEPRPAFHRRLDQISAPHLVSLSEIQQTKIEFSKFEKR
jgi:hypothetical protein